MEGIHRGGHLMGRAPAIGISPGKREKPALRASRRRITPAQSSTKVLNDRGASVTLKPRSAASGSANANGRSSSRAFCTTTTTVPSGLRKAMAIELKWPVVPSTFAEVVVDQVEDVLRVLPAVVAGAAFGLRLDQLDLRP